MNHFFCCCVMAMLTCGLLTGESTNLQANTDGVANQNIENQKKEDPSDKTGDVALKKLVKANVDEMNRAVMEGDYVKLVDMTHPKVVELIGGREKMISVVTSATKEMKSQGFAIRSTKVEEPSDPVKAGTTLYIIAPHMLEMKAPNGKLLVKTFLIGMSDDQGKSWKYVNGDIDAKQIKQLFPDLPAELKLPEKQKLVFEKE